jgi:hypothetical protein
MTIDLVYCRSRRRHRRYLAVTAGAVGELNAYMFMYVHAGFGLQRTGRDLQPAVPILAAPPAPFRSTVKSHCPDCAVSLDGLQASDIGRLLCRGCSGHLRDP